MISTVIPKAVAIDVEATGLNVWRGARMFSAAATYMDGTSQFWRGDFSGFRRLMEDETVDKVFHNAKFDMRMLKWSGIKVRGRIHDTMIYYHLLNGRLAGTNLGLGPLAVRYLPIEFRKTEMELEKWFDDNKYGKKERYEKFGLLPPDLLQKRNVGDTQVTMALFKRAFTTVAKTFPLLLEQEHRLLPVVSKLEERGVQVDPEEIYRQMGRFEQIVENVKLFCEGVVGRNEFNLNARGDQLELLDAANLLGKLTNRTEKSSRFPQGQLKLDDYNLRNLHHPVAHMLLLGKAASKMRNTFLEQMLREQVNGVLHANMNQLGTTTSRFSCSKPNLQNIPIEGDRRTAYTESEAEEALDCTWIEYAPHLKRIFTVREGKAHIHSDKKQAEMAMVAHYTDDPVLKKIFDDGNNFHEEVCRHLYGELTKGLKTRTKAVVFGFIYGAGNPQLAKKIGSTLSEAVATRKRLEKALPSLPRWKRQLESEISERGYVKTIHGRRHYLHSDESYIAVNRLCQGTVADEIKSRMIALDDYIQSEGIDATVVMQIHDDIATEISIEDREKAVPNIHRIMHEASVPYNLTLPSSLDITYTRWADLVEIKDVNDIPDSPDARDRNRSITREIRDEHLLIEPSAN